LSACSPFGKGGWRGILRIYAYLLFIKSPPAPSFPKRGMSGTILKLTIYVIKWTKYINSKIFGTGHEPILIFTGNSNLITKKILLL